MSAIHGARGPTPSAATTAATALDAVAPRRRHLGRDIAVGSAGAVGALCGPVGSVASNRHWSVAVHGWLWGTDDPAGWLLERLGAGRWPYDELDGEFAVVALCHDDGRLHLIRDHVGTRPLYYRAGSEHSGVLDEASTELCGLVRPDEPLDPGALRSYLSLGHHGFAATPYRAIASVPPAHHVVLGPNIHRRTSWWQPPVDRTKRPVDLRRAVERAVQERLSRSSTVDVHISGGLDSSTLACLASDAAGTTRVELVGLEDEHPAADERRFQHAVVAHTGLAYHRFPLATERRDLVAECLRSAALPLPPNGAMWARLTAGRSDATWLMMSGRGGDEVFGRERLDALALLGAPRQWATLRRPPMRKLLARAARAYAADSVDRPRPPPPWMHTASLREVRPGRPTTPRSMIRQHRLDQFISPGSSLIAQFDDLVHAPYGLFLTTPFLDRRVVETALALDPMTRIDPADWRSLQRQLFGHLLPDAVDQRRTKAHFRHVYDSALADQNALLDGGGTSALGLTDATKIDELRHRLTDRDMSDPQPVWRLIATEAFVQSRDGRRASESESPR